MDITRIVRVGYGYYPNPTYKKKTPNLIKLIRFTSTKQNLYLTLTSIQQVHVPNYNLHKSKK